MEWSTCIPDIQRNKHIVSKYLTHTKKTTINQYYAKCRDSVASFAGFYFAPPDGWDSPLGFLGPDVMSFPGSVLR